LKAANIVDLITSRTSTNIEEDWRALEEYLRRCYSSIQQALDAAKEHLRYQDLLRLLKGQMCY
jgi:hypothetical protein